VTLIRKDGKELADSSKYEVQNNNQALEVDGTASFKIKILESMSENSFRLAFKIVYTVEGLGKLEETVFSHSFVCFTSRKTQRERPIALALKPESNFGNLDEEIWIKGAGFNENVEVHFDGIPAKVLEVSENLLTVKPPTRSVKINTPVLVIISNTYLQEKLNAETELVYTNKPEVS